MSFFPLPYELSANSRASTFQNSDVHWDYVIGGIPFFGAQSKDRPMKRQTAEYRKEQMKTGSSAIADPSQLSTEQWWLAGQSSFHGGCDQLYADTPSAQSQDVQPLRFYQSEGVCVSTPGQFSLLNTTYQLGTSLATCVAMYSIKDYVLICDATTVWRYAISNGTRTALYTSATASIKAMNGNATYWFCVDNDGVWRGAASSGTGGTKIYTVPAAPTQANLGWVKQRLMMGARISSWSAAYELEATPAGAPAALPSPKYTCPDPAFEWHGVCDAPGAILMAGCASTISGVVKFTLHSDGATPTLAAGSMAAIMPQGESVYHISSYIGSSIAVVTNQGVRVGQFTGTGGDFSMGPLSFERASDYGYATGSGRFLYFTYDRDDHSTGLGKLDLAQQLSIRQFSYVPDMRYAWAPDIRAMDANEDVYFDATAHTTWVTMANNRLVFFVTGKGLFIQHATHYCKDGTLITSRIRMSTLDLKVFRYVRVRGEGTGQIKVSVGSDTTTPPILSFITVPNQPDSGDIAVPGGPASWAKVIITLGRGSATTTPICHGYQLKALCAQKRQRLIQLPLSCFDFEEDSTGQEVGGLSTAYQRMRALEAIEEAGDISTYQALSPYEDQQETRLVTIDQVQFIQTSMPTDEQGWGGYLLVTLRTCD